MNRSNRVRRVSDEESFQYEDDTLWNTFSVKPTIEQDGTSNHSIEVEETHKTDITDTSNTDETLASHSLSQGVKGYLSLSPIYQSGEISSGFDTSVYEIRKVNIQDKETPNRLHNHEIDNAPNNNQAVHAPIPEAADAPKNHDNPEHTPMAFDLALGVDESIGDDEVGGLPGNIGFDEIGIADILAMNNSPINPNRANFSLHIQNPNSGLFDVASGEEVILRFQGNVVIGEAAGEVVFSLSIDQVSNELEVSLFRAIEHPDNFNPDDVVALGGNILQLQAAIHMHCGRVVSDAIDLCDLLQFKDDGPCINIPEAFECFRIVINESSCNEEAGALPDNIGFGEIFGYQLFEVLPGSDGLAAENYRLNIINAQTSLIDAASGVPVVFQFDGDAVIGIAGEEEVIRFNINVDTGDVDINLFREIVHPDADNPDDAFLLGPGLVEVIAEAIDYDGDMVWDKRDLGNMIMIDEVLPIAHSDTDDNGTFGTGDTRNNADTGTGDSANDDKTDNNNGATDTGDRASSGGSADEGSIGIDASVAVLGANKVSLVSGAKQVALSSPLNDSIDDMSLHEIYPVGDDLVSIPTITNSSVSQLFNLTNDAATDYVDRMESMKNTLDSLSNETSYQLAEMTYAETMETIAESKLLTNEDNPHLTEKHIRETLRLYEGKSEDVFHSEQLWNDIQKQTVEVYRETVRQEQGLMTDDDIVHAENAFEEDTTSWSDLAETKLTHKPNDVETTLAPDALDGLFYNDTLDDLLSFDDQTQFRNTLDEGHGETEIDLIRPIVAADENGGDDKNASKSPDIFITPMSTANEATALPEIIPNMDLM